MEQRTDEWFQARLGKVTASNVSKIMAKTKTGYSADRANYLAQLVCERLTGKPTETFSNAAMQWGTEQEPFARAAYETKFQTMVEEVGFIQHPTIEMAGASPDGFVDDGLIEIKCPNTATMLDVLLTKKIDDKYFKQVQWQLACTKRLWCDFVVFDPRLPERLQLFVQRVEKHPALIAEMEQEVRKFLAEVQQKVKELENLNVQNP